MSTPRILLALVTSTVLAPVALAAQPVPRAGRTAGPDGTAAGTPPLGAELLLGHTGRLQLTDQQVTALAAIARRTYERHEAMRARADSMRAEIAPGRDVGRGGPPAPVREEGERAAMRDETRAELAEAIAVLTPAQRALAWEFVAGHGRRGGPGGGRSTDGPARRPGG